MLWILPGGVVLNEATWLLGTVSVTFVIIGLSSGFSDVIHSLVDMVSFTLKNTFEGYL